MDQMTVYESKMIRLEKIEIGRKIYNDLYTNGLITKEEYETNIKVLCKELRYI